MRIAVLADIHSNLPALTRVLQDVDRRGVDAICCLGDVVGYGAEPAPCVDLVRRRCDVVVRGNHDEAVALGAGVELLPRDGQKAAIHNRALLDDDQRAYLGGLPLRRESMDCTFVHASPEAPQRWMRTDAPMVARRQFDHFDTPLCFVGHTHIPGVMADTVGVLRVRPGHRFLVNPGSVGQPRDGDPRAAYALIDLASRTCQTVRVAYDVEQATTSIRAAGLPGRLAQRLMAGL